MKVKLKTEAVLGKDRKRHGVGSVVEFPAELFDKNSSWLEVTDEPLKFVPPAKEKAAEPATATAPERTPPEA